MKKYFLSTVSVFKHENPYFIEWLEYHLMIGVDHFYLYDQDGGLDAMELLRPYEKEGIVTRHPWTHFDGTKHDKTTKFWERDKSHIAYAHAAKNYRTQTQWLQKLDIDEFLLPREGDKNVKDWLKTLDVKKIKGYRTYSFCFGSNDHIKKPDGLVIENYTRREPVHFNYKDAANGDFLSDNRYVYTSHKWGYKRFKKGKLLKDPDQIGMVINHYMIKSYDEYSTRQNVMRSRDLSFEAFKEFDYCNETVDKRILTFQEELKFRIENRMRVYRSDRSRDVILEDQ